LEQQDFSPWEDIRDVKPKMIMTLLSAIMMKAAGSAGGAGVLHPPLASTSTAKAAEVPPAPKAKAEQPKVAAAAAAAPASVKEPVVEAAPA